MTKKKKEPLKENQVTTKTSGGKITKAKNKEVLIGTPSTKKMQVKIIRTPLVQRQSTNLPNELKCQPKWTSTPQNTANKPDENTFRQSRRKNLKYNDFTAPDRRPLSPILGDIGNLTNHSSNVSRNNISIEGVDKHKTKENAATLPTRTRMKLCLSLSPQECEKSQNCLKSNPISKKLKASESDPISTNSGRITRKRSFGVPKVADMTNDVLELPSKYKNNRCSNLRVRLSRCSLGTSNSTLDDVSSADKSLDTVIPKTINRRKSALLDPKDISFVQCLRDDWSTTSLNDTLSRIQQIRDEIIPLRADKRQLSPLIELSSYENSLSTLKPPQATASANEDDYSSSAEFESCDERENSRSKRAPTWKALSNKSAKSASNTLNQLSQHNLYKSRSMKVRVRKLRIHRVAGDCLSNNKDTEVISGNKKNDVLPLKNIEDAIPTSVEVPSQKRNKQQVDVNNPPEEPAGKSNIQQVDVNNPSEEPAATKCVVSPSQKSANLLNKSDLIEQILSSSPDDDVQHVASTDKTNSNCTRKFFHSHRDNTMAMSKTTEPSKIRRTSRRNKKPDSIYEFLSQSSSESNDPVADIIQKMINNGKVVVAKHKKGTGKLVVPRRPKRKVAAKKKLPKADDVFGTPNPPPSPVKTQPSLMEAEPIDNDSPFDDGGSPPYTDEECVPDQRGFSKLARSAMIKHAGRSDNTSQRKMITDKQQLLAMAQKFVGQSTPVRKSSQPSNATALFSAIPGGSSPWRVDDDKLPNTFYFNRNSDNLPSFSSDFIPSTPSKNKSKSTSSFSSNDSNGENVAPPSAPSVENHTQISSNPRRALNYRSPLKAINILEVVNLPTLALNRSKKDAPKEIKPADNPIHANVSNLFGFEDMIEDYEDDVDVTHQTLNAGKINLKEQLQRLKRLRTEIPKATTSRNNCIRPVFDNERQKQRTLQQMFSSTMIEMESMQPNNKCAVDKNNLNVTGDFGDLFKDPDPETTFDQSTARRSYSRPFKRKRKLRHNFVMFMDSDASEEEEEDDDVAAKKKLKERNKKTPKENLELKKFVSDFNAMYKEVSEYELIVE